MSEKVMPMSGKIKRLEFFGLFFIISLSVLLQNIYQLFGREAIGIMFGSVNNSIWEIAKTLILPYFLWSMLEMLTITPQFKKFVVCKVFALYFFGLLYILLCVALSVFSLSSVYLAEFIVAIVSLSVTALLFCKAYLTDFDPTHLFFPALFLLLLLGAIYFSFTPFPPQLFIFMDRETGLYGIIPQNIDRGAIVLDTIYNVAV